MRCICYKIISIGKCGRLGNRYIRARAEAAAAIREKNFTLTYHGNAQGNLTPEKKLDKDFVRRMFGDVLWWHNNTNGVVSCCSDCITADGIYLKNETCRLFRMEQDFFEPRGIGYGIENSSSANKYCTPDEMNKVRDMLGDAPGAGMILDAGHAHVYLTGQSQKMNLAEYIGQIPFRIHEVHITDNHGEKDEHLLPGQGTMDFRLLREGLERCGFNGVISLEVCPDIQHGIYCWDLSTDYGRDMVCRARDAFLKQFGE